ncbi:hypothetical protein ACQ4LE_000943 [Meloidogyne hapla]
MAEWLFNWIETKISSNEILNDFKIIKNILMESDCLINDSSNFIGLKTISIAQWINKLRELAKSSDFENFYEFCNNLNKKENSGASKINNIKILFYYFVYISLMAFVKKVINL